ncbi:hypothetical protein FRB95_011181 [Tulasnella sp. JGI-2019a]|nr:hypothetical protein FRB95_011181 [Tulasnella sp. JGI-2019a]
MKLPASIIESAAVAIPFALCGGAVTSGSIAALPQAAAMGLVPGLIASDFTAATAVMGPTGAAGAADAAGGNLVQPGADLTFTGGVTSFYEQDRLPQLSVRR